MHLYFVIALATLACFLPHFKDKKHILHANFLLMGSYGLIMLSYGHSLAALIYFVAISGTAAQILLAEATTPFFIRARIIVASIIVVAGAFLLIKTPIDLIAVAGFAAGRLGEAQARPMRMRICFFASCVLFLIYASIMQTWMMLPVQIIGTTSMLAAILADYKIIHLDGVKGRIAHTYDFVQRGILAKKAPEQPPQVL